MNQRNKWDFTPLWDAVNKNNVEAVALLTEEGSSKHYPVGKEDIYPLMRAVENNCAGIVSIFLNMSEEQAQADFSPAACSTQGSATTIAVVRNHINIFRELLKHDGVFNTRFAQVPRSIKFETPLLRASYYQRPEMVRAVLDILEEGKRRVCCSVDEQNYLGKLPLIQALEGGGNAEIVLLLLEHGADPYLADFNGFTPLMKCAESNLCRAGETLLTHVSDSSGGVHRLLEAYDFAFYNSALRIAAGKGYSTFVRMLLDAGADWAGTPDMEPANNHGGNRCFTTLMRAVGRGHVEIVRMLLDAAQREGYFKRILTHLHLRDASGKTAIDYDSQGRCRKLLEEMETIASSKLPKSVVISDPEG